MTSAIAPSLPTTTACVRWLLVLMLAFAWEALEHYLETQAPPAVTTWFAGVEHPLNRLVFDPLCVVLGALAAQRWRVRVALTQTLSVVWVGLHVLAWRDSMYLHRFLPDWSPVFGHKTTAWLDAWSAEHVLMGANTWALARRAAR